MILRTTWKRVVYEVSDGERADKFSHFVVGWRVHKNCSRERQPALGVNVVVTCIDMGQGHQQAKVVGDTHSQCDCYR